MLLVYSPRSDTYDFGPGHPLTPRRFGPGIDLLRSLGAEPGLAPEPALDSELAWCHDPRYIEVVKRFSAAPYGGPLAGIGEGGDDPPFAGMHEAGSMVAGGTLRALEAILRGDHEHAFHPGGGLHHAMPERASGFCIYDDPALAIALARRRGLRVLYVDLDVHHGDGVQAIHWDDPGVLTFSIHESGRYLFPGSGFVDEVGEGAAAGTAVNVPLEPSTGEGAWLDAVRLLLPELAAAFGPDVVISQHGADSHAWDPLAHLRMTTTAMGEAARLVDAIAHRYASGRWLATGGGGYDAYRVVPRMWSLVWLAGAHREAPATTSASWQQRWADEGARYGQAPLPTTFHDLPNAGEPFDATQSGAETRSRETAGRVRRMVIPRLLQVARDRGWWDPDAAGAGAPTAVVAPSEVDPTIRANVDNATWDGLTLASRVIAPLDAGVGHRLVAAALVDGASVTAAVAGSTVVGLAVTAPDGELVALGVAPSHRRRGLAGALLAASNATRAEIGIAERDPVEPLDVALRIPFARHLLERAGFTPQTGGPWVRP
jgi:acetoin utilization protein AcuC